MRALNRGAAKRAGRSPGAHQLRDSPRQPPGLLVIDPAEENRLFSQLWVRAEGLQHELTAFGVVTERYLPDTEIDRRVEWHRGSAGLRFRRTPWSPSAANQLLFDGRAQARQLLFLDPQRRRSFSLQRREPKSALARRPDRLRVQKVDAAEVVLLPWHSRPSRPQAAGAARGSVIIHARQRPVRPPRLTFGVRRRDCYR
jgi:hypothetical protein